MQLLLRKVRLDVQHLERQSGNWRSIVRQRRKHGLGGGHLAGPDRFCRPSVSAGRPLTYEETRLGSYQSVTTATSPMREYFGETENGLSTGLVDCAMELPPSVSA